LASETSAVASCSDSTPVAIGYPTNDYPWKWSIYRWIEGDTATPERIRELNEFAIGVAEFLIALQHIDPTEGPLAGAHNFHRGGSLQHCDAETTQAIALLNEKIDVDVASKIWRKALRTTWRRSPVWVHGDFTASNLLVQDGHLNAVIDFGMLGVGDPACDLSIAWTLFGGKSRETFRAMLPFDLGTWPAPAHGPCGRL